MVVPMNPNLQHQRQKKQRMLRHPPWAWCMGPQHVFNQEVLTQRLVDDFEKVHMT
jgi:hypothetical protein